MADYATNFLCSNPNNAVAILLQTNRASDELEAKKENKDEDADEEDEEDDEEATDAANDTYDAKSPAHKRRRLSPRLLRGT